MNAWAWTIQILTRTKESTLLEKRLVMDGTWIWVGTRGRTSDLGAGWFLARAVPRMPAAVHPKQGA